MEVIRALGLEYGLNFNASRLEVFNVNYGAYVWMANGELI